MKTTIELSEIQRRIKQSDVTTFTADEYFGEKCNKPVIVSGDFRYFPNKKEQKAKFIHLLDIKEDEGHEYTSGFILNDESVLDISDISNIKWIVKGDMELAATYDNRLLSYHDNPHFYNFMQLTHTYRFVHGLPFGEDISITLEQAESKFFNFVKSNDLATPVKYQREGKYVGLYFHNNTGFRPEFKEYHWFKRVKRKLQVSYVPVNPNEMVDKTEKLR